MARARAAADTTRENNPAFLSDTHPVQLQIAPELGPVSCVELVETDADHDQSDQPDKDRAEWGLGSHGARRHGFLRAIFRTEDGLCRDEGQATVDHTAPDVADAAQYVVRVRALLVRVHDPLYQLPRRIPDESGGQDDEQYSALGLRPHALHRAAWPCGRAAQP
jgi:hypothetical protein